jgi:hypothetical protein
VFKIADPIFLFLPPPSPSIPFPCPSFLSFFPPLRLLANLHTSSLLADIEDEEDAENPSSLESLEKEVVAEGGLVKPESEPLFANDDGIGSKTA